MSINRKRKGATSKALTSEQQRRKTMKRIMADARNAEPGMDRPFDPLAQYPRPAPTMPAHDLSARPFQSTAPLTYSLPVSTAPMPNSAGSQLHVSNVAASSLPAPTRRPPSRRTPNLQASRAPNLVRDIRKDRERPYKTEFKKAGIGKKKKVNYRTTYDQAPAGYTFLPIGTNDLAERCKELSRLRNFPVHVVDAEPRSRQAQDPNKISHYVHRIGYHFRAEIVEQAVEELGYIPYHGHYVKEEDLKKEHDQQVVVETARRFGIKLKVQANHETSDQVRAAIKELFPKIPEDDLTEIVNHAWMDGSGRVGTQEHLDLPRRVQLAVIARIRHNYTDYDRLLRAFDWQDARSIVEPVSLQKLLEWRGENDIEDDGAFEEIVRETIVIPSDDEDSGDASGSDADDEETDAENGHAVLQYTHRIAGEEDLRPESVHEISRSHFQRHPPIPQRRIERENNVVRQRLGEAREARRTGNVTNVYVQQDGSIGGPQAVKMGGVTYIRGAPPPGQPPPEFSPRPPPPPPLPPVQYEIVRPSIEHDTQQGTRYMTPPRHAQVIDLTSPEPQYPRPVPNRLPYSQPPGASQISYIQPYQQWPEPEPYDPRQPLLRFQEREARYEAPPYPYVPYQQPVTTTSNPPDGHFRQQPPYSFSSRPEYGQQVYPPAPVTYQQAPPPMRYFVAGSGNTPQPVHGAPAPVQQMPLDGKR